MAYNTKNILRDVLGAPVPQFYNADADAYQVMQGTPDGQIVQISKSSMELFGATVANRPTANTVPVGAIFMSVNTQEIWQSNGTDWVVM